MGHITIKREIGAPVETVFAYVDEHTNTTKYMKGLTRWSPTTDRVHGKDAEFEVVMRAGPKDLRSVVHITSWTENKLIAWKSVEGFKQTGKWAFSQRGDHTEVTFTMDYEFGGGIAGRMVGKVAETPVRWNLEASVEALKAQTEKLKPKAGSGPAPKPAAAQSTATKSTAAKPAAAKRSGTARSATAAKASPAKAPARKAASGGRTGGKGRGSGG
jgi:ribosome-associated toxin RatA of RatAB toxin-antitoxin module